MIVNPVLPPVGSSWTEFLEGQAPHNSDGGILYALSTFNAQTSTITYLLCYYRYTARSSYTTLMRPPTYLRLSTIINFRIPVCLASLSILLAKRHYNLKPVARMKLYF